MSDALDRLKNRKRPKVQQRDASLATEHPDIQISRHIDPIPAAPQKAVEALQVKRSTFRIEAALLDRLHALCREKGISREVFMEAMFEYMEANPDALEQVLGVAISKNSYRQQVANRKRAEAMMEKFGNP